MDCVSLSSGGGTNVIQYPHKKYKIDISQPMDAEDLLILLHILARNPKNAFHDRILTLLTKRFQQKETELWEAILAYSVIKNRWEDLLKEDFIDSIRRYLSLKVSQEAHLEEEGQVTICSTEG